jgi:hypothetical protein
MREEAPDLEVEKWDKLKSWTKVQKEIEERLKNTQKYDDSMTLYYGNMTVVLLLHPKINWMTIPPVVPVKNFRTISLYGNFSNHISQTFLSHSSHWFKLNDVIERQSDIFVVYR